MDAAPAIRSQDVRMHRLLIVLATVLTLLPASAAAADLDCPLASNALVEQAVGSPVTGGIMTDPLDPSKPFETPGQTVCMWDTDSGETVFSSHQPNAFGAGGAANPTDLAITMARLPAEARAEVDALRDAGVSDITLPTVQISNAGGLGDSAAWLFQTIPSLDISSGGFVVQRGVDALFIGITADDESSARNNATQLTQAVLSSLP
jgi:hypothetical protein